MNSCCTSDNFIKIEKVEIMPLAFCGYGSESCHDILSLFFMKIQIFEVSQSTGISDPINSIQ